MDAFHRVPLLAGSCSMDPVGRVLTRSAAACKSASSPCDSRERMTASSDPGACPLLTRARNLSLTSTPRRI